MYVCWGLVLLSSLQILYGRLALIGGFFLERGISIVGFHVCHSALCTKRPPRSQHHVVLATAYQGQYLLAVVIGQRIVCQYIYKYIYIYIYIYYLDEVSLVYARARVCEEFPTNRSLN